jgi:excisionase family DNA binding protein
LIQAFEHLVRQSFCNDEESVNHSHRRVAEILCIRCTIRPDCHYSHFSTQRLEGNQAQTGTEMGMKMNDESTSAEAGGVTPLASNLQAGKFLTVAEVAAILRLSKMSVYRLIHSGQLEAVQFGRSFRVTEKALNTYLEHAYFSAG